MAEGGVEVLRKKPWGGLGLKRFHWEHPGCAVYPLEASCAE